MSDTLQCRENRCLFPGLKSGELSDETLLQRLRRSLELAVTFRAQPHVHATSILFAALSDDPAAILQAIEQSGDRRLRQVHRLRNLARRHLALRFQNLQYDELRRRHAALPRERARA